MFDSARSDRFHEAVAPGQRARSPCQYWRHGRSNSHWRHVASPDQVMQTVATATLRDPAQHGDPRLDSSAGRRPRQWVAFRVDQPSFRESSNHGLQLLLEVAPFLHG